MRLQTVVVELLTGLLLVGCSSNGDFDGDQGNDSILSVSNTGALMSDADLQTATFVDLNFAAFPRLPTWEIPASDVIYVATNGSDTGAGSSESPFASLQSAVDAASEGTTIVVRAGTYSTDGVSIGSDGLSIIAEPGGLVRLTSTGGRQGFTIEGASDLVLRGMQLSGFQDAGVAFVGNSQRNIVLADLAIDGSSEGIVLWGDIVDGLLAYNVRITNCDLIGFHAGNGTGNNWRLENVVINMRGSGGGSGADAFAIEHGDNILVVNSEVSGASADGIDTKATRVVVYGCYVHDIERNGIKFWDGGDVINTVMHHTGADAAFVVERGPRVRILHSVMAHHEAGGYGMTLGYDSPDASIRFEIINSTIFDMGAIWTNSNTTLAVSHSIFHEFPGDILAGGNPGIPNDYGPDNQLTNPQLDGQYRPASGGPAVNHGVRLGSSYPAHDKDGAARVQGSAPDVGPYEVE